MVLPDDSIRPLDAMTKAGIAIARVQKRPIDLLAGRQKVKALDAKIRGVDEMTSLSGQAG